MATGGSAGALRRFELDGVRDTGREEGHGSYAVVKVLEYHGLKCVGKKVHGILFELAMPHEKAAMLERFAGECELLSGLHHPCIIQFLGVWYEQGSRMPVLVMEYLHTTLSTCLERYGVLPKEISYGILRDVALGLRYLHERSPPIIHRDLSANNVLLTSNMNAKISDLGVAKILNLIPAQMTQTKGPGTPCYMPPEALTAKPKYASKIDIYSYGILIIHTLCGRWPFPKDAFLPDPRSPDKMIPISEVERRAEYLQEIGNDHPLTALIRQCLSNAPAQRPEASAILNRVNTILSALTQQFTNQVEMLQQLQMMVSQFETRIQTLTDTYQCETDCKESEIDSLIRKLELKESEIKSLEADIQTLTGAFQSELHYKQSQIDSLTQTNQSEIKLKQSEIESLKAEIKKLSVQSQSERAHNQPCQIMKSDIQNQPQFLHMHPQAKLQWKESANMPVGISKAQAVMMGNRVYIGGGVTDIVSDLNQVLRYDPSRDEWSRLPPHHVVAFGMAQFAGNLITVGGRIRNGRFTGKVYRFKEQPNKWEEFLTPMPTARYHLSVATTQSAIVASGGSTGFRDGMAIPCVTVEVYSTETSQWHTADSLPVPCGAMTSVTAADIWYQLGGGNDKDIPTGLYAPLNTLVQKAISPTDQSASHISVWNTLPDTPLMASAAASLSGNLLALGGHNETSASKAVNIFVPLTNFWIRVTTGDLPEPRYVCTTVQLSSNQVLVVGGFNDQGNRTKTVFLGFII